MNSPYGLIPVWGNTKVFILLVHSYHIFLLSSSIMQCPTVPRPSCPTSASCWWVSQLEGRPTLPGRSLASSAGSDSALKVSASAAFSPRKVSKPWQEPTVIINFAYPGSFLIFNVVKMDSLHVCRGGNVTGVFLYLIGSLYVYRFILI